jgi:uracil-DNA glycosylase
MCFSVKKGVDIPPSLRNIYKELKSEYPEFVVPKHGFLESWSKQGVLLLNATLTVRKGDANSHSEIGWSVFTDKIISIVSQRGEGVVFMLWGKFAQAKKQFVDKVSVYQH